MPRVSQNLTDWKPVGITYGSNCGFPPKLGTDFKEILRCQYLSSERRNPSAICAALITHCVHPLPPYARTAMRLSTLIPFVKPVDITEVNKSSILSLT